VTGYITSKFRPPEVVEFAVFAIESNGSAHFPRQAETAGRHQGVLKFGFQSGRVSNLVACPPPAMRAVFQSLMLAVVPRV
jgi:hypothetical protein